MAMGGQIAAPRGRLLFATTTTAATIAPIRATTKTRRFRYKITIKKIIIQTNYVFADAFENQIIRILNKVHASIDRNEQRLMEQDRRELTELEWKHASIVLDRLLLAVFLLITIISTTTILCRSPNDAPS